MSAYMDYMGALESGSKRLGAALCIQRWSRVFGAVRSVEVNDPLDRSSLKLTESTTKRT